MNHKDVRWRTFYVSLIFVFLYSSFIDIFRYVPFDFHHECRKMRWDRLSVLLDQINADQAEFRWMTILLLLLSPLSSCLPSPMTSITITVISWFLYSKLVFVATTWRRLAARRWLSRVECFEPTASIVWIGRMLCRVWLHEKTCKMFSRWLRWILKNTLFSYFNALEFT